MQLQSFATAVLTAVLATLSPLPAGAAQAPAPVSTRASVVFNTVCARCHEGECSGRLSFDESFQRARGHMARHYPPSAEQPQLQRDLFTALAYMKDRCGYYPMEVAIPPQRVWEREQLDALSTGDDRAWFVPAGRLTPGRYELELELDDDRLVTVHLLDDNFDSVIENCYRSTGGHIRIPFDVEDAGTYYVRLYLRRPVTVTRLGIRPE